jgi:hypothetical protein
MIGRRRDTSISRPQQQEAGVVASQKKRRKDGDRRQRGGLTADQAMADKRLMRQLGAPVPRDPDEAE